MYTSKVIEKLQELTHTESDSLIELETAFNQQFSSHQKEISALRDFIHNEEITERIDAETILAILNQI